MNQNPTIDNDLQKAIDDITKNTNEDPVFGDPVAAPAPAPAPAAPAKPAAPKSFPTVGSAPAPRPVANPAPRPAANPAPRPRPMNNPAPMPPAPAPTMAMPPMPTPVNEENHMNTNPEMQDVKEAALRDLAPLVDKLDVSPSKKFNLYRDIREELHDDSVIAPAYESAKDIADDTERADALLYLVESIDNM